MIKLLRVLLEMFLRVIGVKLRKDRCFVCWRRVGVNPTQKGILINCVFRGIVNPDIGYTCLDFKRRKK